MENKPENNSIMAVLTPNTVCNNRCSACYYKWRGYHPSDNKVLESVIDKFDTVAIGINSHVITGVDVLDELDLLELAIAKGKSVVVTACAGDGFMLASKDLLNKCEAVSLSLDKYHPLPSTKVVRRFNSLKCTKVISLIDTGMSTDTIDNLEFLGLTEYDCVYVLCEKGDPSYGFNIMDVTSRYSKALNIALNSTDKLVVADGCVSANQLGTTKTCMGGWVDVQGDGAVRYCPYDSQPDFYIKSIYDIEDIFYRTPCSMKCNKGIDKHENE